MKHLKSSLSLLVLISLLGGCKSGPKLRLCSPVHETLEMVCHDQRNDSRYDVKVVDTSGYRCLPSEDYRQVQLTCSREDRCILDIKYTECLSRPEIMSIECTVPAGPTYLQRFDQPEADDYICSPSVDWNTFVSFCEARC
jgi:hypothetical protein